MRHLEGQIQTSDGLSLYSQSWLPDSEPKAALSFIHGQSDHSGRYANLVNALIPAGYALFMADLRGHGKSPGLRGHILSWEDYRRDMTALMEHARQTLPDIPHFFGGHSMGGLLALNIALDNPPGYQGVVASAPMFRLNFAAPPLKVALGQILNRIAPATTLGNEVDPFALSRDFGVVEAYRADPLVHGKISARAYFEIVAAMASSLERAAEVRLPILLMQGNIDPLVSSDGSREFHERAGRIDKTYKLYDGLYHEIFNEPEKARVLGDLINWLDAHV